MLLDKWIVTLCAKLSGAVYCYRSCLWLWCLQLAGGVRTSLQPARAQCLHLCERFFHLYCLGVFHTSCVICKFCIVVSHGSVSMCLSYVRNHCSSFVGNLPLFLVVEKYNRLKLDKFLPKFWPFFETWWTDVTSAMVAELASTTTQ